MKLWKSLLISSLALSSLHLSATESGQHVNQSVKHSALAGSTGLKGSGQVAVSAVTTPVIVAGGASANVGTGIGKGVKDSGPISVPVMVPAASLAVGGSAAATSAQGVAEKAGAPVPFKIGEQILVGIH
ncbi:hypothetical protein [Agarivorans sp. Toyoura001]|uniref:hypothetical protein n=1 Tax=unclassified Agarivorans TaxID=2636026 RepID=UPI0010F2DA3D|nr:hypothetical protein [Agarivorans sp. Toyoura001]GDY26217.1 hypothetical protein AHAT_21070 [Agarivorans sp. Toyoura001]